MRKYILRDMIHDVEEDLLDAKNVLVLAEEQRDEADKWVESRKRHVQELEERLTKLKSNDF